MPDLSQYFPITNPTIEFFVVLCIILFAPIVMGKLRIPHIIGMVLAGVAFGEYGLNILMRDEAFELFGRVGLLYIMFLAGLEMDIESIRKSKNQMLVFGLLDHYFDLERWISGNTPLMILLATAIGFIPQSGPHIAFVSLFASGVIPFPVLLANSISQDGHASLPLLSESKSAFLRAKTIKAAIAILLPLLLYGL